VRRSNEQEGGPIAESVVQPFGLDLQAVSFLCPSIDLWTTPVTELALCTRHPPCPWTGRTQRYMDSTVFSLWLVSIGRTRFLEEVRTPYWKMWCRIVGWSPYSEWYLGLSRYCVCCWVPHCKQVGLHGLPRSCDQSSRQSLMSLILTQASGLAPRILSLVILSVPWFQVPGPILKLIHSYTP